MKITICPRWLLFIDETDCKYNKICNIHLSILQECIVNCLYKLDCCIVLENIRYMKLAFLKQRQYLQIISLID